MRKTRKGADRIATQALRTAVGTAKHELDSHLKGCAQCSRAGSDVYDHCAQWWTIAIMLHRARRNLRRHERPEHTDQEPLPDMDIAS